MLTPDAADAITQEEKTLTTVVDALQSQRRRSVERLSIESVRARELTSAIVATRRDEDKQLIASDEAVSHGLRDKKEAEIIVLDKLTRQPYFARFVVEEENDRGRQKLEYRIGFAENADCRIIDWRKAPIARLYYEYKEGDEYSEEILGRERIGKVLLRNRVEIENSALKGLSCSLGNFEKRRGEWIQLAEPPRSRTSVGTEQGPASHHLPQIASLLTPEQFELIAESNDTAMLIQGIAGSGKTTVALHRLAWLLGAPQIVDGEPLTADRCAVIVLSRALRDYVSRALPAMGVEGVRTITLIEWLAETVIRVAPRVVDNSREHETFYERIRRPKDRCPLGVERLKRSLALLKAIESTVQTLGPDERQTLSPEEVLLRTLDFPRAIIEHDDTKLLDQAIISQAKARTSANRVAQQIDNADDALLVRIYELQNGGVYFRNGSTGRYGHLLADEVQDFSPVDLACLMGAIGDPRGVTLVGDTAQKIDASSTFPGWDKLRRHWAFKESMSKFISLNLSQRSTLPIVKLADFIQRRDAASQSRAVEERAGRTPIWFKCENEEQGVEASIDWLTRAGEKYPGALSAVICRTRADADYVFKLLQPTFGPLLRRGDDYSFTFIEGVIVTNAEQVKGLEFTNVLIWNPHKKDYPADDLHRNILYTAVTRAEENLCLVTWLKESSLLPNFYSALVRGYDLVKPPEEQDSTAAGE